MISVIQDKSAIETDEEFNKRISNYADVPRIIREIRERREGEVKSSTARHYNKIVSEISRLSSTKSDPNRLRFLERVRDSLSLYLIPEDETDTTNQIDYPTYYILLYLLEDGEKITYIGIDENDKVTIGIDGSDMARAAVFLVEKFQPLLQMKHGRQEVEMLLSALFN